MWSTSYAYYMIGRLGSFTHNLNGLAYDVKTTFNYNPTNQITSRAVNNDLFVYAGNQNITGSYAVNGLNQYTGAGSKIFSYDANSNLTSDGSTIFAYDAENRLVSAAGSKNAALKYDPKGPLFEVKNNTSGFVTHFLYDGNITNRYLHGFGVDEPYVWYPGNSVGAANRRNLYADHQGSIVAVTNSAAVVQGINTYDAYGIPSSNNLGRFSCTGQIYLSEVGLQYYKARMYSPALGRFLQTDPIGYEDQMNLYAYVGNDPINKTDPTGMNAVFGVDPKAAGGNGHTTLYFQDKDGKWNAYNQGAAGEAQSGGNTGFLLGQDAKAGVTITPISADSVPKDGVVVQTTSEQDAAIATSAAESMDSHNSGKTEYNLYSNNCTDAAVDVVNNSGAGIEVSNPATTVKPNSWIEKVKNDPDAIKK